MTQSESGDRVSILNDAVDAQGEGRGCAQLALVEVTVGDGLLGLTLVHGNRAAGAEIVVGQVDGGGGDLRAVDGELAGVKDMQAAVLQRSLNLGDLLSGAVGDLGAKVGDGNSAILIAALIPWSIAGSLPCATLGVTMACLPYALYLYLVPLANALRKDPGPDGPEPATSI